VRCSKKAADFVSGGFFFVHADWACDCSIAPRSYSATPVMMIELIRYQRADGREPFGEWLSALRDNATKARIRERLRQVEAGNLGDIASVGNGVFELRIHFGAG
jgi:hypothetical protein